MAVLPFDQRKLNGAFVRSRRFVAGFTSGQKTVTVLALLAVIVGGIYFATHSSAPSYTVLFANLQPEAAGQVTQQLTNNHIPYELSDGGTTVLVPQSDVNQERISLAEAGLPSGGTITFSTLANTGITSSQFVQDVDYQQALSSQLAQTIESIQGVQTAEVQLVVPQQTSFAVGTTGNPSASVLVALQPGVTLTTTQVQAIVHLTASAVPDLSPSAVTVVDNQGDVLSAPGIDDGASANNQQTIDWDNTVAGKINSILAPALGANNFAVQVNATLDFNQVSSQTNSFVLGPNGKPVTVPTNTQTSKETFTGSGQNPNGVLGAATPATGSNSNGTYDDTTSNVSNSAGSTNTTTQQAVGLPTSTAVAVLVNSSVKGATSTANLTKIRDLVAEAAGLNLKARDSLVVTAMPFAPTQSALPASPKASMISKLKSAGPAGGLVILVLLLFFAALRVSKKRSPRFEEIPLAQLGAGEQPALGPGRTAAELDTGEVPVITASQGLASLMPPVHPVPVDVDSYIKENPTEVAQLMRHWSRERSSSRSPSAARA
ncbi:MAG TPA: flagellar basal-body MS-ring/collar protein FliF [Acidimicrobiales bacterium]|nr:flagellar basal-body MS-ring/collar protein FliF [Acidimicrobiales bacterium]